MSGNRLSFLTGFHDLSLQSGSRDLKGRTRGFSLNMRLQFRSLARALTAHEGSYR